MSQFRADDDTLSDANTDGLEKEFVFKVVVLGSYNVGKTTFIKRLLHTHLPRGHNANGALHSDSGSEIYMQLDGSSDDESAGAASRGHGKAGKHHAVDSVSDEDEIPVTPTVGTDFYSCVVPHVTPRINVRLQLWDTAGLARYTSVSETTYKNSSLVICLFDISDKESLAEVTDRHLAQAAEFIPDLEQDGIFVIANKMDLMDPKEKEARAASRQRAASPEAAFSNGKGDNRDVDDDETTDLTSSVRGGGPRKASGTVAVEDLVTVKDVQDAVLDLFSEVHYGEVSARRCTGMSRILQRICLTLLRNEGALTEADEAALIEAARNEDEDNDEDADTFVIAHDSKLRHSSSSGDIPLAPVTDGKAAKPKGKPASTGSGVLTPKHPGKATQPPSIPDSYLSAAPTDGSPSVAATALRQENAGTPASLAEGSPTGSWKNMGFSFDMGAPGNLGGTAIFSPASLPPTPAEGSGTSAMGRSSVMGRGPQYADPNADTEPPTSPPMSQTAPKRNGTAKRPNETKAQRLAREKAEMSALLGKPKQDADEDRFRSHDLDAAENAATPPTGGNKFHSLLDDVQAERDQKRYGDDNKKADDNDDDDGAGLRDTIQNRYADIYKSAEAEKDAIKLAEKRDKKYGTNKAAELKEKMKQKEGASVADMYKKKKANQKCKCDVM